MKTGKLLLIFTLLYFLASPVYAARTILVLGDSLSAGYGINPQDGWVAKLQQRLDQANFPYKVINSSISGDTTSNGLARLPSALKQYQPEITLIELGGNDGLRGLSIADMQNNLQNIINLTKLHNSKIILIGVRLPPNYGLAYTRQFQAVYSELAKKNNVALVPLFLKGIDDNPQLLQADQIHPLSTAQNIMLENVWPTLEKYLTTA